MDQNYAQLRLKHWMSIIQTANTSGLSKKDWCKKNGISRDSFYYWQKKIRELAAAGELSGSSQLQNSLDNTIPPVKKEFFEISLPDTGFSDETRSAQNLMSGSNSSGVVLHFRGFTLDINEDSSMHALANVIKVLKNV